MALFQKENNLTGHYAVSDYIERFFSFENFLEKLRRTKFNIEEIYNSPSSENINKLIEFVKISKDSQENVKRYDSKEENFLAKRDYHFFSPHQQELKYKVHYYKIHKYLFTNNSSYSLAHYLEKHYITYEKDGEALVFAPDFEKFHTKVVPYIDALKDRIQLFNTLLDANANEFTPYDKGDELVTEPFPVVFVTETKGLEIFRGEFRSRVPLQLGKDILLVATDNQDNQKRLRDYLQKNNVGPVEVLLFDDLQTLSSRSDASYFDAFANDDLIKAFELAKKQNHEDQFSKLYRALSELNEKRYRFKSKNPEIHEKLNNLFIDLQGNILTPDKEAINFRGIQNLLQRNKQENHALYATHRGVLGVIDTLLTILASLVIFYPIVYWAQKSKNSLHTFFSTGTEKKVNCALDAIDEVIHHAAAI